MAATAKARKSAGLPCAEAYHQGRAMLSLCNDRLFHCIARSLADAQNGSARLEVQPVEFACRVANQVPPRVLRAAWHIWGRLRRGRCLTALFLQRAASRQSCRSVAVHMDIADINILYACSGRAVEFTIMAFRPTTSLVKGRGGLRLLRWSVWPSLLHSAGNGSIWRQSVEVRRFNLRKLARRVRVLRSGGNLLCRFAGNSVFV